jgi:catechol 2,3-dioxygenase-like lactoylglutathione lyase family enzyme
MEFEAGITFCYTRDLKTTSEFYEKVLGLELALDQGGCRIYRTAASSYLGFCERATEGDRAGIILTLVTDDVDGWHERLLEQGVPVEHDPRHNPEYMIYHFFFRDPNGYMLEIQRFENPKWPG